MSKLCFALVSIVVAMNICAVDETISLRVGEKATVSLPSNRSKGYSWALKKNLLPSLISPSFTNTESTIKYESSYELSYPDWPNVSREQDTWIFKAMKPGFARVQLEYKRGASLATDSKILLFRVSR